MLWTTDSILQATDGEWVCGEGERTFSGISIDSRTIVEGQLFVAIEGEVHDGHRFVDDVVRNRVVGLIVRKGSVNPSRREAWHKQGVVCIGVDDTLTALGDLAAFVRRQHSASVVAVTGSNGKTTTRGMISGILSQRHTILSTRGNFNNLIGLPLVLLDLDPTHEWVVLELGMNRPGEIDRLGCICRPDVGVITNIGPAHLGGFDSIEGIVDAKGELLDTIHPDGVLVLNTDDERVRRLGGRSSLAVLSFGLNEAASIRAHQVTSGPCGTDFQLVTPSGEAQIHLNSPGNFMVLNALAAAAVGHHVNVDIDGIRFALEDFEPDEGRLNVVHTRAGVHIIDDTYNANPASMEAAIRMLGGLKGRGRRVLVAGEMLELGRHTQSMHRRTGAAAAKAGVARIYATGSHAQDVAAGARDEGFPKENIVVATRQEIAGDLKQWLQSADWVLIKGSRGARMETVFHSLRDWAAGD